MSAQQKRFTQPKKGMLATYRELTVGDAGYGALALFELYSLLFTNLPALPGYAARRAALPWILKRAVAPTVGKGVTLRTPNRISLGRGVILDDYSVLDIRIDDPDAAGTAGIEIGDHALIGRASLIVAKNATIKLGNACNISSNCRIATQSRVEIGDSVLIAAYAYIGPGNHAIEDGATPIIEQAMDNRGGVTIGDHAWIGTRATVLDGVKIGAHAVVGAHSLVREDVPEGAIVAGTPAKILKYR